MVCEPEIDWLPLTVCVPLTVSELFTVVAPLRVEGSAAGALPSTGRLSTRFGRLRVVGVQEIAALNLPPSRVTMFVLW